MGKRRVGESWASFERAVLPSNASPVQRSEMRRAFYAGAFTIMDVMADAMSDEAESTPEDERAMVDLATEREQYLLDLKLGRA